MNIFYLIRQCLKHFLIFVIVISFTFAAFANGKTDIPLPKPKVFSHSLSLSVFISQALANNPAIQATEANVAAAEARQRASSNPLYNPELAAEGQNATEDTYSVGINQTVDWANKRGARARVGAANVEVAEAQLKSLRQALAAQLLAALARNQAAQQIVTLSKKRTALLQQFVTLTKKLHVSGDVARVDVDLAQLALSEALAQQANAEVNLNQAVQTLTAITGLKHIRWPSLPRVLPPLNFTSAKTQQYLNLLPEIQVLNNQYLSAAARIRLAERERYPDPTVGIQGGYSQSSEGSKPLVGVTLSIPLYVRNPYQAEVDAANYDAVEADRKRMDLIRQAHAEIENSAKRYQTLYLTTQQWQRVSGKPLTDGMTLIERLWRANEITTTDYLVQLKQRIDSQIAGAELKGQAWQAWAEWQKASGQIESWIYYQ